MATGHTGERLGRADCCTVYYRAYAKLNPGPAQDQGRLYHPCDIGAITPTRG